MAAAHANVIHTPNMDTPHDNDPVTFGTILKYLGTILIAILIFVFGWIGRLITRWATKQFESYVKRIEQAVDKVETLSQKLDSLAKADADLTERVGLLEQELESFKLSVDKQLEEIKSKMK